MKITRIAIFLFVLCSVVSLQGANIDTLKVHSASMNKEIPVIVISPETTDQSARFPVIYLLHGHGGDEYNWIHVKPELPQMADRDGIIVVCPDGENSWYWDSPINPAMRYETFVSQELPDYVDQHYPTIADRTGRTITGLSMGGHGAMWISIRHSDRFGASGATSGGVDIRPFPENWNMADALGKLEDNREVWENHTVINLVDQLENGELAIIFDCGYDDFFFEVNKNFHEKLRERGIDHDYIVRPGAHNAAYWNNAIDYQWIFFKKYFDKNTKQ